MILKPGTASFELGPFVEVLTDKKRTLGFDYVSSPRAEALWKPNKGLNITMPSKGGAYWIRFKIVLSEKLPQETWMLETGRFFSAFFDEVDLYVPLVDNGRNEVRPSYHHIATGAARPRENNRYTFRAYILRLPENFAQNKYFYLRLTCRDDMEEPLTLWTADSLWVASGKSMIVPLVAYGVLLAMLIYNLFLLLTLYDRAYLYYVVYIFTLLAWQSMAQGHIHLIVGFPPGTFIYFDFLAGRICVLAAIIFIRYFLETRKNTPIIDKVLLFLLIMTFVSIIKVLLGNLRPMLANLIGLTMGWVMMVAAIARYRQGFQPALQIILAWSFMMIGTLTYFLRSFALLPATAFTVNAVLIGGAMESIFISFALGSRIRELRQAKLALEISERRYKEMSHRDELTGLFNKRHLIKELGEEITRAHSKGSPFSLLMLDVDNFKRFNDVYGHRQGDKVLAVLGDTLNSIVRQVDVCCRYGGEEFAVLLPGVRLGEAYHIAERIRESFSSETFHPVSGEEVTVTVSLGAAELSPLDDPNTLIDKADQALYRAKSLGRNRTETHIEK